MFFTINVPAAHGKVFPKGARLTVLEMLVSVLGWNCALTPAILIVELRFPEL